MTTQEKSERQQQKQQNEVLANKLKEEYLINKNVSDALSLEQKQEILDLLESNESVFRLVQAFVDKNNELGNNNRKFGKQRNQAHRELDRQLEKNNQLATDLSQLRAEFIAFRRQTYELINSFQNYLTNNMSSRSEILTFLRGLKDVFVKPNHQ